MKSVWRLALDSLRTTSPFSSPALLLKVPPMLINQYLLEDGITNKK